MGTYATVEPEYADLVIDRLGLDIGREQINKIGAETAEIVIILDDKAMSSDKKTSYVYSKSDYVIAKDGSKSFYLAVRYTGVDEKGKPAEHFEPLEENKELADKRKERRLSELDDEIERKEGYLEYYLENEIKALKSEKDGLENEISELQKEKENKEKSLKSKKKQYKKLVGKIESLRESFLIRVLFRIYKLELD